MGVSAVCATSAQPLLKYAACLLAVLCLGVGQVWGQTLVETDNMETSSGTGTSMTVSGFNRNSSCDQISQSTEARTGTYSMKTEKNGNGEVNVKTSNASISVAKSEYLYCIGWAKMESSDVPTTPNANIYAQANSYIGGNGKGDSVRLNNSTWRRFTSSKKASNAVSNASVLLLRKHGSKLAILFDDVVIYTSSNASVDITAPTAASSASATTSSIDWTCGSDDNTGIQNTLIWRRTSSSADDLTLNDQGVYAASATDQSGHWTCVSATVGAAATSYAGTFSSGDRYAIVHRDLAYNYSSPTYVSIPAAAPSNTYYYRGTDNSWGATAMTPSEGGTYEYIASTATTNQFKIALSESGWDYNHNYNWSGFFMTDQNINLGDYNSDDCYIWDAPSSYYIIVFKPSTAVNSSSNPHICVSRTLPDDSPSGLAETKTVYLDPDVWEAGGAKYAVCYVEHNGEWSGFMTASPCFDGVYQTTIPVWVSNVEIVRFNSTATESEISYDGGKCWNYSGHLSSMPSGAARFTVAQTGGTWNDLNTSNWSTPSIPTYTINYAKGTVPSGGGSISGSKSDESKTCGVDFTLPNSTVFTITGYTQTGWATSSGGSKAYELGGSYTGNANQTFYPFWTANNYTLTWITDGDALTGSYTTGTVAFGTAITAPNTPTKTGYNFAGWDVTPASTMPADNTTYTATWTAKTTSLTLNPNTDNHGTGSNVAVTATYAAVLPSFTKATPAEGYVLEGYYTTASGEGTKIINADGTLVASTDYTSDDSKWNSEIASLTLHARYDEIAYCTTLNPATSGSSPTAKYDEINMQTGSTGGSIVTAGAKSSYSESFSYTTNGLKFNKGGADSVRVILENNMRAGTVLTFVINNETGSKSQGLYLKNLSKTTKKDMIRPGTGTGDTTYVYTVVAEDGLAGTNQFILSRASSSAALKSLKVHNCGSAATTYNVTHTLSHVTKNSGATSALVGANYTAVFTDDMGFDLPSTITVEVNGEEKTVNTHYTWNQETGTVVIYGAYVTDDIEITITGVDEGYTITNGSPSGGSIAITFNDEAVTKAQENDQVNIVATPSTGYSFSSWSIYKTGDAGTTVSPNASTASTYFTMPAYGVTVDATFTAINYAITHAAADNGTYTVQVASGDPVSEGTGVNANYGQTITLAATPGSGYVLDHWTVTETVSGDPISVTNATLETATFTMPAVAVTIVPTFKATPNIYYYKDATRYVSSTYKNPEGGTAGSGDNKNLTTPWKMCDACVAGVDSVVVTNGQYDGKGNYMDAYIKLGIGGNATSKNIIFGIKNGYTASSINLKIGGYSANPTVTLKKLTSGSLGDAIAYTGTIGGVATKENDFSAITWSNQAAGVYVLNVSSKNSYISEIDIQTTPLNYTVTLNANDGTINAGNVTSYTYGTGATLPTDVTKDNYTFGGWYEASDFSGSAVTTISTTDYGNKTYYAKWYASDYSYTPTQSSGTLAEGEVAVTSTNGVLKYTPSAGAGSPSMYYESFGSPSRNGLRFNGSGQCMATIYLQKNMQAGTIITATIASVSSDKECGLELCTTGSETVTTWSWTPVENAEEHTFTYTVTAEDDLAGTNVFRLKRHNADIRIISLIVANCSNTEATCTVTYHSNGATSGSAPDAANYLTGTDVIVKDNTGLLQADGNLVFAGWATSLDRANAGTVDYNPAAGATIETITADVNLYPVWKTGYYFISLAGYSANGTLNTTDFTTPKSIITDKRRTVNEVTFSTSVFRMSKTPNDGNVEQTFAGTNLADGKSCFIYDTKTTQTDISIYVYNDDESNAIPICYRVLKEGDIQDVVQVDIPANSGMVVNIPTITHTKGTRVLFGAGTRNGSDYGKINFTQVRAIETGIAVPQAGEAGFELAVPGRFTASKDAASSIDGLTCIPNDNVHIIDGKKNTIPLTGAQDVEATQYISFTTSGSVQLQVTPKNAQDRVTFYVKKDSRTFTSSDTPYGKRNTITSVNLPEAGTWYILSGESASTKDIVITKIAFVAAPVITYDANGGTGEMSTSTCNAAANSFTPPTGYSFAGWNTAADGSGTAYAVGDETLTDLTLYAQWSVNSYTITLDKNGGSTDGTATVSYGGARATVSAAPTYSGYEVTGYFTEAAGGIKVLNADGSSADNNVTGYFTDSVWTKTADCTLFAHWGVTPTAEYLYRAKSNLSGWESTTYPLSSATAETWQFECKWPSRMFAIEQFEVPDFATAKTLTLTLTLTTKGANGKMGVWCYPHEIPTSYSDDYASFFTQVEEVTGVAVNSTSGAFAHQLAVSDCSNATGRTWTLTMNAGSITPVGYKPDGTTAIVQLLVSSYTPAMETQMKFYTNNSANTMATRPKLSVAYYSGDVAYPKAEINYRTNTGGTKWSFVKENDDYDNFETNADAQIFTVEQFVIENYSPDRKYTLTLSKHADPVQTIAVWDFPYVLPISTEVGCSSLVADIESVTGVDLSAGSYTYSGQIAAVACTDNKWTFTVPGYKLTPVSKDGNNTAVVNLLLTSSSKATYKTNHTDNADGVKPTLAYTSTYPVRIDGGDYYYDLKTAYDAAAANDVIYICQDFEQTGEGSGTLITIEKALTIAGENGVKTITRGYRKDQQLIQVKSNCTFRDLIFEGKEADRSGGRDVIEVYNKSTNTDVTFDNVTFSKFKNDATNRGIVSVNNHAKVTFNDVMFVGCVVPDTCGDIGVLGSSRNIVVTGTLNAPEGVYLEKDKRVENSSATYSVITPIHVSYDYRHGYSAILTVGDEATYNRFSVANTGWYKMFVHPGGKNELAVKHGTYITFDKNGGDADGSAEVAADSTDTYVTPITHVTRVGYNLTGYYTAPSAGTKVLNADGTYAATNVTGYITDGKWTHANVTLTLYAQWTPGELTFTGETDAHWSTASNWSPAMLPTIEHDVVIEAPVTVDIPDARAASIALTGSATMTVQANQALVVAGTITKSGAAPTATDLLLESSAAGNATLIFDNSNSAAATVEMYSKASAATTPWSWQYIGVPFTSANAEQTYYGGYMYGWKTDGSGWETVTRSTTLNAFTGYSISYPATSHTYSMTGTLAQTTSKDIAVPAGKDMVVGNSWTAPIQIKQLRDDDFTNLLKNIYLYNTGMDSTGTGIEASSRYEAGTYLTIPIYSSPYTGDSVISSLQGFFVTNTYGSDGSLHLSYDDHVRPAAGNSVVAGPMHAPRRMPAAEEASPAIVKLIAGGSRYDDRLVLLERGDFTTGYDDGWDGEKWPGGENSPALYATRADGTADAVSAIPELEGTPLTFRAGEDDVYTLRMEYKARDAEPLYLYDTYMNAYTRVEDGATYSFLTYDKDTHTRFILTRYRSPQVATGDEAASDASRKGRATKLIIDQKLYILRNGVLYDATGKCVKQGLNR